MKNYDFKYYFERKNGDEEELLVSFEYTEEEPMVRYYPDGSGYPGCAAEINIYSVQWKGREIYGWIDKETMENMIEKADEFIQGLEPYEPDEDILRGR